MKIQYILIFLLVDSKPKVQKIFTDSNSSSASIEAITIAFEIMGGKLCPKIKLNLQLRLNQTIV